MNIISEKCEWDNTPLSWVYAASTTIGETMYSYIEYPSENINIKPDVGQLRVRAMLAFSKV